MNRREFVRTAGAVAAAPLAEGIARADATVAAPKPALMKVGTQHGDSDAILRALGGFGVNHICSRLPSETLDQNWSVDALSRLRDRVSSFGVTLDMVPLPMSSNEIDRFEMPNIMLGTPQRDREIDAICEMIRNTARAG